MPELYSFLFSENGDIRLGGTLTSHSEIRQALSKDENCLFTEVEWLEGHHPIIRADSFIKDQKLRTKLHERFPTRDTLTDYIKSIKTDRELACSHESFNFFLNYDLDEETKEKILDAPRNGILFKLAAFCVGNYNNKNNIINILKGSDTKTISLSEKTTIGILLGITEKFSNEEIVELLGVLNDPLISFYVVSLNLQIRKFISLESVSNISLNYTFTNLEFLISCFMFEVNQNPGQNVYFDGATVRNFVDERKANNFKVKVIWFKNCRPFICTSYLTPGGLLPDQDYKDTLSNFYTKFPTRDFLLRAFYDNQDIKLLGLDTIELYDIRKFINNSSIPKDKFEEFFIIKSDIDTVILAFCYLNGSEKFKKLLIAKIKHSKALVSYYAVELLAYSTQFTEDDFKTIFDKLEYDGKIILAKCPYISADCRKFFQSHLVGTDTRIINYFNT